MMSKRALIVLTMAVLCSSVAYATQPWVVNLRNRAGQTLEAGTIVAQNTTVDNVFRVAPAHARAVLGVLATNCTNNTICAVAVAGGPVSVLKVHRANNTLNSTAAPGNLCWPGKNPGEANCSTTSLTGAGRNATLGIVVANSTNRTQTARILLQIKPN